VSEIMVSYGKKISDIAIDLLPLAAIYFLASSLGLLPGKGKESTAVSPECPRGTKYSRGYFQDCDVGYTRNQGIIDLTCICNEAEKITAAAFEGEKGKPYPAGSGWYPPATEDIPLTCPAGSGWDFSVHACIAISELPVSAGGGGGGGGTGAESTRTDYPTYLSEVTGEPGGGLSGAGGILNPIGLG